MRIGTRGSALALAQARWVAERLHLDCEIVTITTAGDRGAAESDKSRWVSELERALLEGSVDLAVHSAKDVPAELADGLELVAIPQREEPLDALCGAASLDALPQRARVGTSSVRRASQLLALRPDLEIVPVRGNVDTRLRKLAAGEVDALVLAMAGLRRLGLRQAAGTLLGDLVPAAGQGALAVQARPGTLSEVTLAGLHDSEAAACVLAERELTRALGASCATAVGALASTVPGGVVELRAWVGALDGSAWVADRAVGRSPEIGAEVARRMLAAGAGELLSGRDGEIMSGRVAELEDGSA